MTETKTKPVKLLSPKLDVVFQSVFGEVGDEKITKDFLESVFNKEIGEVKLDKNPILRRELEEDKMGILDVIVEVKGKENINIEMQLLDKKDVIERILFYWSKLYIKEVKKGEKYKDIKRTVVILIADFEVKGLEEVGYHTKWKLIEEKERKIVLTEKAEIHIIELPKIQGREEEEGKLLDWLFFLENPESERVKEKMEENEGLKEAVKKVERISEEEKMQRIAELREKALRDEASAYAAGQEDGEEKGKIEQKKEIAKEMLKEKMDINLISKITKLSIEEIQKLKEETK